MLHPIEPTDTDIIANMTSTPPADVVLQGIWKDATESFQSNLTASQYQKLLAIGNLENLRDELARGEAAYKKRTIPRLLARLDPFFKQLKFFSEAISILVSSNPEIAALVWGSIYMVLEVSISILVLLVQIRFETPLAGHNTVTQMNNCATKLMAQDIHPPQSLSGKHCRNSRVLGKTLASCEELCRPFRRVEANREGGLWTVS